jgi:hypothetical protein
VLVCCLPRRANRPGRFIEVRRPHWCFPRRRRYTGDPPPMPSSELEEERSPPPTALTDRRHLKVGKMSSLHCPDAVGLNRVENQALERLDYEAPMSPYGATTPGLSAAVPSVTPAGRSAMVHSSKNRRSRLEPIHAPSSSRFGPLIQAPTATV